MKTELKQQNKRTALILVGCVLIGAAFAVLFRKPFPPTQAVIQQVLDNPEATVDTKQKGMTTELIDFIAWYQPRVLNAGPEVLSIMKQFDASYKKRTGIHMELETMFPTDWWIQRVLDKGITISSASDYSNALNVRWSLYHEKSSSPSTVDGE